jgi:hypothetical protein
VAAKSRCLAISSALVPLHRGISRDTSRADDDNYPPHWNGAPSQDLLVIRRNYQTGEVSLDPLRRRWGSLSTAQALRKDQPSAVLLEPSVPVRPPGSPCCATLTGVTAASKQKLTTSTACVAAQCCDQ